MEDLVRTSATAEALVSSVISTANATGTAVATKNVKIKKALNDSSFTGNVDPPLATKTTLS